MGRNKPSATFYFKCERTPDEEMLLNLMKKLKYTKTEFFIWMMKSIEELYGLDFEILSQTDLIYLMRSPVRLATHPIMPKVEKEYVEAPKKNIKNKNMSISSTISEPHEEIVFVQHDIAKQNVPIDNKNVNELVNETNNESVTSYETLYDDEMSESQTDMLLNGLSDFGI